LPDQIRWSRHLRGWVRDTDGPYRYRTEEWLNDSVFGPSPNNSLQRTRPASATRIRSETSAARR
jgi:hypothetical protein